MERLKPRCPRVNSAGDGRVWNLFPNTGFLFPEKVKRTRRGIGSTSTVRQLDAGAGSGGDPGESAVLGKHKGGFASPPAGAWSPWGEENGADRVQEPGMGKQGCWFREDRIYQTGFLFVYFLNHNFKIAIFSGHCSKHFIYSDSFNRTATESGRCSYPHWRDEDTEMRRVWPHLWAEKREPAPIGRAKMLSGLKGGTARGLRMTGIVLSTFLNS